MTKLMKQLQRWATEGALIFPCEEYQNGAVKTKNGILHTYMIHEHLQHVLDGTIKVLRPVEHYKPKNDERVLLYDPTHTDEYGEPLTTVIGYYREEDGEFHRFESYRNGMTLVHPTHWQPLAQPPQKGGEV